jgi:hypothetical protein
MLRKRSRRRLCGFSPTGTVVKTEDTRCACLLLEVRKVQEFISLFAGSDGCPRIAFPLQCDRCTMGKLAVFGSIHLSDQTQVGDAAAKRV